MSSKISGARRSAILLLSLDADSAAEVFKFLPGDDVESISLETVSYTHLTLPTILLV